MYKRPSGRKASVSLRIEIISAISILTQLSTLRLVTVVKLEFLLLEKWLSK